MSIDELAAVLPPPAAPRHASGRSWPDIEASLGLALPTDFKAYVAQYGFGIINELVMPLNPHTSNPYVNFEDGVPPILQAERDVRAEFAHRVPFPIYPEPGGIYPWAVTDNGDYCFWITDPPDRPDEWRVAVDEVRGLGFLEIDASMTSLLVRTLSGELVLDRVFGEDFAEYGPAFEPYD